MPHRDCGGSLTTGSANAPVPWGFCAWEPNLKPVVEGPRMHVLTCSAILFSAMPSTHLLTVVFVSAIIQWLLGALWYGLVFRKSWMTMAGCLVYRLLSALLRNGARCEMGRGRDLYRGNSAWHRLLGWLYCSAHVYAAHFREPPRQSFCHQCGLLAAGYGHRRRSHGGFPQLSRVFRRIPRRLFRRPQGQFPREIAPPHLIAACDAGGFCPRLMLRIIFRSYTSPSS
jgi:hypothetical protein